MTTKKNGDKPRWEEEHGLVAVRVLVTPEEREKCRVAAPLAGYRSIQQWAHALLLGEADRVLEAKLKGKRA